MRHGRRLSVAGVVLLVLCGASVKGAVARDAIAEARIRAELATRAPQAVAAFDAATRALDAGDSATAARGYREVLAAAPDFTPAMRRLGAALMELDQRSQGLALTERAVEIQRSPDNLASLALALMRAPSKALPPSPADLRRAMALAREAALAQPQDATIAALWAQAALQSRDEPSFREALARLRAAQPDHVLAHYFAAVAAAMSGDAVEAEREIREAERRGLPKELVDELLASGVGQRASVWRWAKVAGWATALWAAGLLGLFVIGKVLSARTLAALDADDPSQELSPSTRRLRSIYARVVSLAGTYWYVSLPFVALLVVALAASLFYGFWMIGRIPIKLAAIVAIGVLVTLYALVRSLFVRIRDDEDPGRGISEQEAPGLWALTREVAREVGTRPIDEIWLTPGTDMAVFERGGLRARMRDRARRALLLGAGILEGFDRQALRAVLAHEYGHFSHRDTAGGDVAFRVRTGMRLFFLALARSGYAVWWNVAFQFLRLYDFIFRRISHGATRLQEVLADRTAIRLYGLDTFKEGLIHVIRREVLFGHTATSEIEQAVDGKRAIANLYRLPPPKGDSQAAQIESEVEKALNAPTSEDDTHPGPQDRFRLGARITSRAVAGAGGPVWDLFRDPDRLMNEMTATIAGNIAAQTGIEAVAPSAKGA